MVSVPGVTRCRLSFAQGFAVAVAIGPAGDDGEPVDWVLRAHPASTRPAAAIATTIFVTRIVRAPSRSHGACTERPPPGPEPSTRLRGGRLAGRAERPGRPGPTGEAPR